MRQPMDPKSLRKMQMEFLAIGAVGIVVVGIFAALDAGNDLGEVLRGLVQFLLVLGGGVAIFLNRHRLLHLVQSKINLPAASPSPAAEVAPTVSTPADNTEIARLVLVAPGRHQMLTFAETIQALESAVYELNSVATLQGQLTATQKALSQAENQLRLAEGKTQRAFDTALATARAQWQAEHASTLQRYEDHLETVKAEAAASARRYCEAQDAYTTLAATSRTTLPLLQTFIFAVLEGKWNRELAKTVAHFGNAEYGPFAQSVRAAVAVRTATRSPLTKPEAYPPTFTGEIEAQRGIEANRVGDIDGRTEYPIADGPTDGVSDGAADGRTDGVCFALVRYNADFARIVAGAPPEVIYGC